MALFGIVSSLADAGQLGTYQQPLVPLLVTALVTLVILVGMERLLVRRSIPAAKRAQLPHNGADGRVTVRTKRPFDGLVALRTNFCNYIVSHPVCPC